MVATSIKAAKGRLFLLQLGSGVSPETYTTITGMRTTDITINSGVVDITNKSSNGWQELLPAAGVRSADIAATGIWDSNIANSFATLFQSALDGGTLLPFRLISEAGDFFQGDWAVFSFKRTGPYNNAETFDLTLRSHGPVTYVPA